MLYDHTLTLAIDPGPEESGWVVISEDYTPVMFDKEPNRQLLDRMDWFKASITDAVIEQPVCMRFSGASISDTAIVAGMFAGILTLKECLPVYLVNRAKVRGKICGKGGNDSKVINAMADRFAPGVSNRGKGKKDDRGFFYGFTADVWQAFALGVVLKDLLSGNEKDLEYISARRV